MSSNSNFNSTPPTPNEGESNKNSNFSPLDHPSTMLQDFQSLGLGISINDSNMSTSEDSEQEEMLIRERAQRFNKESQKVNIQVPLLVHAKTVGEFCANPWWSNEPVVDVDFSQLVVPTTTSSTNLSVQERVKARKAKRSVPTTIPISPSAISALLSPPPHAFVHDLLSINYVISVVGLTHFVARKCDGRMILHQTSQLRTEGVQLGLPIMLMEWLCGDDESVSAAEEGVVLTRDFFAGER